MRREVSQSEGEPEEMHMNVRLRRGLMVSAALGMLMATSACAQKRW